MSSVKCIYIVYSVECKVHSVSVKRSVECKVWSVKCKV